MTQKNCMINAGSIVHNTTIICLHTKLCCRLYNKNISTSIFIQRDFDVWYNDPRPTASAFFLQLE